MLPLLTPSVFFFAAESSLQLSMLPSAHLGAAGDLAGDTGFACVSEHAQGWEHGKRCW